LDKRNRMAVDLPPEVQMAIRLCAIKRGITTGDVVAEAIEACFSEDMAEAKRTIADQGKV
jgi:hypothetical protein